MSYIIAEIFKYYKISIELQDMNTPLVSISEASRMLGVSEVTLRQWSNDGQIKVFLTPGGHRRYHRDELKCITANRRKTPSLKELTKQFAQTPVVHQELTGSAAHYSWYQGLSASQSRELMVLGQGMLDLMLKYLTLPSKRPETLELAHVKGETFGNAAARIGLSLTDAVEIFTQHRSHVMHFIAHVFNQNGSPGRRTAEALALVTELMDKALVSMIISHQHLSLADDK